jgi:cytochrome c5
MHKITYPLVLIIGLILLGIINAACTPKTEPSTPAQPAQTGVSPNTDGATLLSGRCTACHSLERVESKHKTQDEWKKTISRMVEKGAVLDPKEVDVLVEYLTKTYGP